MNKPDVFKQRRAQLADGSLQFAAAPSMASLAGDLSVIDFGDSQDFEQFGDADDMDHEDPLGDPYGRGKALVAQYRNQAAATQRANPTAKAADVSAAARAATTIKAMQSGALAQDADFPILTATNASVIQTPASGKLPGRPFIDNISRQASTYPIQSLRIQAPGAGVANETTLLIDGTALQTAATPTIAPLGTLDAPGTAPTVSRAIAIPMVFVTISAPSLNAASGAAIQVWMVGKSEAGFALSSERITIKRGKVTEAIELILVPFFFVTSRIRPALAVAGTLYGQVYSFTVKLTGLTSTETVSLVVPGPDSMEMDSFKRAWKLKI